MNDATRILLLEREIIDLKAQLSRAVGLIDEQARVIQRLGQDASLQLELPFR